MNVGLQTLLFKGGLAASSQVDPPTRLLSLPAVRRVPPRFSIPPTNQQVMPGGSVNLTCVAVGAPMPYVKWLSGGLELTREEEMPIGRNVLELTNIRQSANYTCMAVSSLGVIETTAQICVKGQKIRLGVRAQRPVCMLRLSVSLDALSRCGWLFG